MITSRHIRSLTAAAGLVAYMLFLPYMFSAWKSSPLDRWDWIWLAAFLLLTTGSLGEIARRTATRIDHTALPAVAAMLGIIGYGLYLPSNAVAILGACGFSWAIVWWMLGWSNAAFLLPYYGILALSCTGSSYWLGTLSAMSELSGVSFKILLTLPLVGWIYWNYRHVRPIKRENLCFLLAVIFILSFIFLNGTALQKNPPFLPRFSSLKFGNYLGRIQEKTEADRRFFGDSEFEKYLFAATQTAIQVLEINCGNDVHQIHPAGYCLRSSGWQIQTEERYRLKIRDRELEFNEIVAENQGVRILLWVWYSDPRFSTSSFFGFRRFWSAGSRWVAYQVSVPLPFSGDKNEGRRELAEFLEAAPEFSVRGS